MITIDDDEESITVTPRRSEARVLTPPRQPQPVLKLKVKLKLLETIPARYPTVVFIDGTWTEIWCGSCGTNINLQRNYLLGLTGLLHHQAQMHKDTDNSMAACMKTCGRRVLGKAEVDLMQDGLHDNLPMLEANLPPKAPVAPGPTCTGNVRFSGIKVTPIAVKPPTADHVTMPATGSFKTSLSGTKSRPTQYEIFQNLEAEARAAGTPPVKKQRTSLARANLIDDHDEADYDDGMDDHPSWKRCR